MLSTLKSSSKLLSNKSILANSKAVATVATVTSSRQPCSPPTNNLQQPQFHLHQQQRNKHSNRQINRLFKKNPAFHRVAARNATLPKKLTTPPPTQTIDAIFNPSVVLPNGWSQPPSPTEDEEVMQKKKELPFSVKRTGGKPNGAIGFLPVYKNVRLGGSRQTTIVKKISGDKDLFLKELRAVLSISAADQDSIRIRAAGDVIEVAGNRSKEVKAWLAGLGF